MPSQTTIATSGTSGRSPAAAVNIESFCSTIIGSNVYYLQMTMEFSLLSPVNIVITANIIIFIIKVIVVIVIIIIVIIIVVGNTIR